MDTSHTTADDWVCTWHTGPDAGGSRHLSVGRHLLGRAHTAGLRCDDPGLQPHHAMVEVHGGGRVTVTQLTGRTPILMDGSPLSDDGSITDGACLEVGTSRLAFTRGVRTAQAAHIHDGALVRVPRALSTFRATEIPMPKEPATPGESAGGLVPAVLGLAGAAAIAMVMQQPMFLLFGLLGALVAVGSWAAQRITSARRRTKELAIHRDELAAALAARARSHAAFRAHHLATVPTVADAHRTITERSSALWTRRAAHSDAFLASVGFGDLRWPDLGASVTDDEVPADDMPVPADLGPGSRLAVRGPQASSVTRGLLVQLAASCGPADLRIVVVTDRHADWDCVRNLPHLGLPDGTAAVVTEAGLAGVLADLGGHSAHLVFVTDHPELLATRTSSLRRAIADPDLHAVIVVLADDSGVPHLCTSVLSLANGPIGRWVADTRTTMLPVPVRVAGIGERATFTCASALRSLVDPEDPLSVATGVPRDLSLTVLLGATGDHGPAPSAITANWLAAGADPSPRTLIGMAADGAVDIDLVRDGPHGLIAGTTGAGKSELLRSLVAGMAAMTSPTHLSFVLVDYKGGATFDACAALPHVVGVVTDLDDHLADRALRSLQAELRRRESLLRDHGAADLAELRAVAPDVLLPRLVVVIDEFAALVAEQPNFLHALVGIAQRGRSLGVHLLLATQRPNGVISDDIRANTNLRLALRLQDTADAIDVVGIPEPALLPRGVPGRAVMRLGADDHVTFQTARCTGTQPGVAATELEHLVRAIVEAARVAGIAQPPAPWQPALPAMLVRGELAAGAVGLIDDPDHQRTLPLHWSPLDGHLLVAGSPGAGVTSTLFTLAAHTLAARDAAVGDALVYVLDGRGDDLLATLAGHPRCAAVVRLHERERLMRLVHRLRLHTRTRLAGEAGAERVVLFVDGLDAVRRTLDDVDTAAEFDALEEVLADGEAAGITIVAGVEHAAAVPMAFLARCANRWVLHLHDAHDATLLGVPAAAVPTATPGRLVVAASGLVAQLVQPGATPLFEVGTARLHANVHANANATPIDVVPALVDATSLDKFRPLHDDSTTALPLGIDFATGGTHQLLLPDGEHVLIVGGARSGRSTALARLAAAWSTAHPDGWVGAMLPRRSSFDRHLANRTSADLTLLDTLPARGPVLLVIDDAETVDDPAGRLAALAAGARAGTCIIAAGRPDALRQTYGHWTGVVRRSRIGLVATGGSELDGDLLGVALPRRTPVTPRAGLTWVVANGSAQLVQVAVDTCERRSATPVAH